MSGMFENCENLTSLDISDFDTNNVKWMGKMFNKCSNLTTIGISDPDNEFYQAWKQSV
jgi:surface protein